MTLHHPKSAKNLYIVLVVIFALVIRLMLITRNELWLDEACSVMFASLSWHDLIQSFAFESHPPLYYLLLKPFVYLFGFHELTVRMPSLIFSLLSILLLWEITNRKVEISVPFLAISPIFLHYSVEARQYSLVLFLTFLAIFLFKKKKFILLAFVITAGLFAHYIYAFFISVFVFWETLYAKDNRLRYRLLLSTFSGLLPFLAWFYFITLDQMGEAYPISWLRNFYGFSPMLLVKTVNLMGPSPKFPSYSGFIAAVDLPPALSFFSNILIWTLFIGSFLTKQIRTPRFKWGLMFVSMLLSLWLFSYLVKPLYLPGRYDIFSLPVLLVFISFGTERLPVVYKRILTALLVVLSAVFVSFYLFSPAYQSVTNMLTTLSRSEPYKTAPVIAFELSYAPVKIHNEKLGTGFRIVPFPSDMQDHPGWFDSSYYRGSRLQALQEDIASFPHKFTQDEYVVTTGFLDPKGKMVNARLNMLLINQLTSQGFRPVQKIRFRDYFVFLFKHERMSLE